MKKERVLIDVAISGDRNVINKDAEKVLKYEYLAVDIQCMWNSQTKAIPVTIWATGTISKSFTKYLSNMPAKYEINCRKQSYCALPTCCGKC